MIGPLRLYLETTVFNYHFDADREGHEDVVRLFEAIRAGEFKGYISRYVTEELISAPEPKRSNMLGLIARCRITDLHVGTEVVRLARSYISSAIIPASYFYDSAHIAVASVYGLDRVISYNFKHINRNKTRLSIAETNQEEGYPGITICTAREVLDHDRSDL